MPLLTFEVTQQGDGSFYGACQTENIFVQAPTRAELEVTIKEALRKRFYEAADDYKIRLVTVRY